MARPQPAFLFFLLHTLFLTLLCSGFCSHWNKSEHPFLPIPDPPLQQFYDQDADVALESLVDSEYPYNELETSLEENSIPVTPPELRDADNVDDDDEAEQERSVRDREKRSGAADWQDQNKGTRRVQTGATILNIRGAVRDAIGDAGAAPGPRASSRLDTFVIRPAAAPHPHPSAPTQHKDTQKQAAGTGADVGVREVLVRMHGRARLECDLPVGNATRLRWYKDDELVRLAAREGGEGLWAEDGGRVAVVGRATRADAGRWRCTGLDSSGHAINGEPQTVLVYEAVRAVYLAVDGRRLDAGNTWVPVRDRATLEVRCVAEGGVPAPALSWRLTTAEPALDPRAYLRAQPANRSLEGVWWSSAIVVAARELHNATLRCSAVQRVPPPASAPLTAPPTPTERPLLLTAQLQIHVTYPPSFVISRWPGFGVSLVRGSAAALRCDVDANPPARAWWLRDDHHTTSSPTPAEDGGTSADARGSATLRWPQLGAAHAGWYRCRASWLHHEYSSIGYYLNVLEPGEDNVESEEAKSENSVDEAQEVGEAGSAAVVDASGEEAPHQRVDVALGGSVQLHCPKGSVGCWWRRIVGNGTDEWAPAGSARAHGVLGIKEALYEEAGEYRCVGARAPDLARLRDLKRVTLKVTGGATAVALSAAPWGAGWRLECGVCGRGARAVWVRGGGGEAGGRAERARLLPDLAQHCWRTTLHVVEPDEVWCVASAAGGGAVAVFPPRAPPAPARHTVRAPPDAAPHPPATTIAFFVICSFSLLCN